MYVTDVHITYDENNPDGLKETAYNFNNTIASAKLKNPDISLILSAGDQPARVSKANTGVQLNSFGQKHVDSHGGGQP